MEYPLHEKLKENKETAEAVSEFLDFLEDKGYRLARYERDAAFYDKQLRPVRKTKDVIIGEFLDIDPAGLEAEKQEMLSAIRAAN